jgi:Domain of unknown function (DUF4129)
VNRVVRARQRGFALPGGDRRWPGPLAVVLGAAACALVVIAAAGEPLRRADRRWARLALSPWLLAIPVGVVVVIGLVAMTNARPAGGSRMVRRRASWLTILGFVAVAVLFSHLRPEAGESKTPTGELEIGPATPAPPGHRTGWPTWLAIAAGGAMAVVALGTRQVARAGRHAHVRTAPDADGALRAVESSLADLHDTDDARAAVITAYRRLLDGLDDAGAGRRDAEAPFEHVTRALSTLGVRPEPLRDLTALFAEARFSDHAITEAHRAAAVRALDAARTELQAVAGCA